jgi:dethiobiotin synthetase
METHEMTEDGPPDVGARRIRGRSLFEAERLGKAAWAFTTRRVSPPESFRISHESLAPRTGDLILARVDVLGHHRGLQLWSGRKQNLFPGDEIVVAYGNRYAPSQFEAVVPQTPGPCHLVAGGGVAAKALSWHDRIGRGPTCITPIGYLVRDEGERANLADYAIEAVAELIEPNPTTIAVVGTAMDAGKTESAAYLVRGLTQSGLRVGFAKITGTGAGGDTWLLKDAGAEPVLDFTDSGFASTYLTDVSEIERILVTLVAHLTKSGVNAIVIEVADGILQPETAALLESPVFRSIVGGILFTARDSMGAMAGVEWLKQRGLPIVGLSGIMTAAPLQRTEASDATGLPTYTRQDLGQAALARKILAWVVEQSSLNGGANVCTDGA